MLMMGQMDRGDNGQVAAVKGNIGNGVQLTDIPSLSIPRNPLRVRAAFVASRKPTTSPNPSAPLPTLMSRKNIRRTSLFAQDPHQGPAIQESSTTTPDASANKRSEQVLDDSLFLPKTNDDNFYGRFITLGYHKTSGPLNEPLRTRSERNKTFELWKRVKPNGWKFQIDAESGLNATTMITPAMREQLRTMSLNTPILERTRTSIRLTGIGRPNQIVEYTLLPSAEHDLFQFGRDQYNNDFHIPGHTIEGHTWDPVSRLAFRVQCNRDDQEDIRIYAAGFDYANELFLGPYALRWSTAAEGGPPGGVDGGITVGLYLWKPNTTSDEGENLGGEWYEVSALGELYHLRIAGKRGRKAVDVDNKLTDGCIIVNANSVLLFTSTPPSKDADYLTPETLLSHLSKMKDTLCPITFDQIPLRNAMNSTTRPLFPAINLTPPLSDPSDETSKSRAGVFPVCGHVFELLPPHIITSLTACPTCRTPGRMIPLLLQCAPTFLRNADYTHVLPCGHGVSEMLGKRMASVGLPTNDMLVGETDARDWGDCLCARRRRCWFCGAGFYPNELRRLYLEMEKSEDVESEELEWKDK